MLDQLIITTGSVFAISGHNGDIHPHTTEGFYAYDTRFLSSLKVSVNGQIPCAVSANQFDHFMASFYTSSHQLSDLPAGELSLVRERYLSSGLHEDIDVLNHSETSRSVHLEISCEADFADVFEVRRGRVCKTGQVEMETRQGLHLCFVYTRGDFRRETWITFSIQPVLRGNTAIFDFTLAPKETWRTCITIHPIVAIDSRPSPMQCIRTIQGLPFDNHHTSKRVSPSILKPDTGQPIQEARVPRLETENAVLQQAYKQAISDLRPLQMEYLTGRHILAAGLPWFMAVFGRDSITAAIQTKLLGPELMIGTLHTLANLQATEHDPFREAEPGKIPHEVREGELSVMEEVPHSRYYGSIDATILFLILLWEVYQWTGDKTLLAQVMPQAEAALLWIDQYGDWDGDGFVEYRPGSGPGLRNQGWKDSSDAVCFADGTLAQGPIALAEVQGYVYDAKCKMAELYQVLGQPDRARQLQQQARKIRDQFNEAFWLREEGYLAMALDGEKRPVDAIASNAGQCLWSGIVDRDKAPRIVERLMDTELFSGWGIRTLSTRMARYHPLSYHNGSIWPHDNSLIAAGMARYGFNAEAREITLALLEATTGFRDYSLPELFAGYPRREHAFPVPYPAANAPQAWACGAVIYSLETLLGLRPEGKQLRQKPLGKSETFTLDGVCYRNTRQVLRCP